MPSLLSSALLFVSLLQVTCTNDLDLSSLVSELVHNLPGGLDTSSTAINNAFNIFSIPRQTVDRDDLHCVGCNDAGTTRDTCCPCRYAPKWEGNETNLMIEYTSVTGKSVVLSSKCFTNTTVYMIEARDAVMGDIPSNICNWDTVHREYPQSMVDIEKLWDKVVKIDFTGNEIRKIVDLNCLSMLDTLNLGFNKITYLRNDSFNNLTHLRVLNLEQNLISTMDPSVLTDVSLHLTHVYLQDNLLQELDITNGMSLYPFCTIDYSDNTIREITNVHDYKLDSSQTYGPGYVSIQRNAITQFPDLSNIMNLGSIQELGQLLAFGFDLKDVPLQCNGAIEPYLEIARQLPSSFWRGYDDITCVGPENMAGKIIQDVKLEELVTDYPCYQNCECQDRPSQDYVYVDCNGRGITDMSKGELPNPLYCNDIHLDISNNDIRVVTNITNLDKVTVLDISNNDVVEISEEAALQLENLTHFELTNNTNLKEIPEQFRYLDTCGIHLGGISLACDCDSTWISEWSNKTDCDDNVTAAQCIVPGHGVMSARDFHKDMLDCLTENTFYTRLAVVLSITITMVIILAVITYQLRYEILIIILRLRRSKSNEVLPRFSYDVYLSFDDENTHLRKWVNAELIPELKRMGYNTFLPYRDVEFGAVRDNVTIDVLTKTRNFLVILSQSYLDQGESRWADLEWKHGWHMFKANKFKSIVLVNFDHMSSFDVDHPQIKAFLRVGGPVDFTNEDRDIIKQISAKLGPPLSKSVPIRPTTCFDNVKTQFDITKLFVVDGGPTKDVGDNKTRPATISNIVPACKGLDSNTTKFDRTDLNMQDIRLAEDISESEDESIAVSDLDGSESNTTSNDTEALGNMFVTNNKLVREQPRPGVGPFKYNRVSLV